MNVAAAPSSIWTVTQRSPEKESLLVRELGVPAIVAAVLVGRGLESPDAAQTFLKPELDQLHDPSLLPDYSQAVAAILRAKDAKEKFYVHGDYDVDGVTSAALFTRFLRKLGCDVVPHVPHREREGYGIHISAVRDAAEQGAKLFLTCDCGVSAFEQVEAAHEAGMRVVVTDHHEVGEEVPNAEAVVNPHRKESVYPWSDLSGVGVAFKLCAGITSELGHRKELFYRAYLDLAALGTVADVMPLLDENRVITKFGLSCLGSTKKEGLRALLEVSNLDGRRNLTARNIGFQLGPRINAVGRIDDSDVALRLLLTEDRHEAVRLAEILDEHNQQRRAEQDRMLLEAIEEAEQMQAAGSPALVIARKGWHPGIIGIVAGKLAERFRRPTFVIAIDESGQAKGSARSIEGFNLAEAIGATSEHLKSGGGHEMAAGFSLDESTIGDFRAAVEGHASLLLKPEDYLPKFKIDAVATGAEAGPEALADLQALEPFGQANPEPLFASHGVHLLEVSPTSNPDHARLTIEAADGTIRSGMAFGIGRALADLDSKQKIDVAFTIDENHWNGRAYFRWMLRDYKLSSD